MEKTFCLKHGGKKKCDIMHDSKLQTTERLSAGTHIKRENSSYFIIRELYAAFVCDSFILIYSSRSHDSRQRLETLETCHSNKVNKK